MPDTAAPWRKESAPAAETNRGWQSPDHRAAEASGFLAAVRHRAGLGILLAAFSTLAAVLLYTLLFFPAKTPIVAAVAVEYHWPLPPNAWAEEDVEALKTHLGDQTLAVREVSLAGASATDVIAALVRQVQYASLQSSRDGAVLLYLSAHGAVDGRGEPCLLLPESDPLDSATWLRMSELLAKIKAAKISADARPVLILDCTRQIENWGIGSLSNEFAQRLSDLVTTAAVPGLAVVNSTSPGEVGLASIHLQGSVFGHFVRLGLAGAADEDGNGRVSLRELGRYLRKNVDDWAREHRSTRQTPQIYPENAADCPLTWSLEKRELAKLTAPVARHDNSAEASAAAKLAPLWTIHQKVSAHHPHHLAPIHWQELEHDLLWLEQAAMAGESYRPLYDKTFQRVRAQLDSALNAVQPQDAGRTPASAPMRVAMELSDDQTLPLLDLTAFSRPLGEYLGNDGRGSGRFSDAQLTKLFDHYGVASLWLDSSVVERVSKLHDRGEQLAVPRATKSLAADDRAHSLIRPLLAACDRSRRLVEDGLYLGPHERPDLAKQIRQVGDKYEETDGIEAAFAEAYQVRDRAWAELPYLAVWSAGQEKSGGGEADAPGNKEKEAVIALAESTNRLDQILQTAETQAAAGAEHQNTMPALSMQAAGAAHDLAANLDRIRSHIVDAARRLPLMQATPAAVRESSDVLASPLVSGVNRGDVYAHYVEMLEDVDSAVVKAKEEKSAVKEGQSASNEGKSASKEGHTAAKEEQPESSEAAAIAVTHWTIHPLAIMLKAIDAIEPKADADLVMLGQRVRDQLRRIAEASAGNDSPKQDSAQQPREGAKRDSSSEETASLAQTDRRLRCLAELHSSTRADPGRWLRRRQLQDILLWHAERALDDFWGSTEAGSEPYFSEVADSYLASVRLLAEPDLGVERQIERLGKLANVRRDAARRGLTTTSTDLVLIDEESEATAQVGIHAGPDAIGLPIGVASVYLRDGRLPVPQTIHALDLGPGSVEGSNAQRTVTIAVRGKDLIDRNAAMQAIAWFRGQEFPAPLMKRDIAGARIELDPHRYGPSRITLRGERFKRASLVFILDCSHSMNEQVPLEEPSATGGTAKRMKLDIAVDALRDMLERLGEEGDVRVGVRFFGHRVGWRTDQNGVLARQEGYPGGVSPTLHPYDDIELFLPLGRFDSVTAGIVSQRLKTLKPWGESPIYLSLMDALHDFGAEDANSPQRVVVITDGMNYQFNPPPESSPSLQDVETAFANKGVAVDIVGFAIPTEERSTAVREFEQLTSGTKGSFTLATNASALVRRLQEMLLKTEFSVTDDAGRTLQQGELGGTVVVSRESAKPEACSIEADHARAGAVLEGGEALQLILRRAGPRIVSPLYEEDGPIFAPLVTPEPTSPTGYQVGLHRPRRETGAVVFPISFQKDDLGVPTRPSQIWIEITPVADGRSSKQESYIFYDENYEPDLPVPLMMCRCRQWPRDVSQAEVRIWCSPRRTDPLETVPLAGIADRMPAAGEGFAIRGVPGVTYQVRRMEQAQTGDRSQIRIVERHSGTVPVDALKVELSPRPVKIIHQFDAERGIVLHTFEYAGNPGKPIQLQFQTRERFTSEAWRTEQPISLTIAKHSEVIVPPRILDNNTEPSAPSGPAF